MKQIILENDNATMTTHALNYLKQGFSVIPVNAKEKKPYFAWAEYQKKLPTEEEVCNWWTKYPQADIAIVTGFISSIAVIDIDSIVGKEQLNEYIPDSLTFPIAISPSGGEHWYFRCLDTDLQSKARIDGFDKVDIKASGGLITAPPSIGANGKAYTWKIDITQTPIPTIPEELYRKLPKKNIIQPYTIAPGEMFGQGRRDGDLFHIANALVKAKLSSNEIFETLRRLATTCNPPFGVKEAEQKVISAIKRATDQPRDIKHEVMAWCAIQDGNFKIDACFNELYLQNKEQKADCRNTFNDLVGRGIIEREKGIGVYRLLNKEIEYIKIPDSVPTPMDISWPFYMETFCNIYPGNIAVIAGTSNAGKTAYCINFAKQNLDKHQIRYQSSEMDGQELRVRLEGFGIDMDKLKQIEWIHRSKDWWDLILPDAINIIDYMEIYDNFYEIGQWIKNVFDRLNTGIALIALQKKDANTDEGRGGAITKEKARIYISMNFNQLKIVKAKNWATSQNPNGMNINFEMEKGIILKSTSPWGY